MTNRKLLVFDDAVLASIENKLTSIENKCIRIQELVTQLIEARGLDDTEWTPTPGDVAELGLARPFRRPPGGAIDFVALCEATGDPLEDLASGALRVTASPVLNLALQIMACSLNILVDDHMK